MKHSPHTDTKWKFVAIVSLLIVASAAGISAPEKISWLQGSVTLRWAIAILGVLVVAYILAWLSSAAAESSIANPGSDWQKIRSNGKWNYVQRVMIADLNRTLYFQPLISLIAGWILNWELKSIIGIVSFLTFITIFASFFNAIRQWQVNEESVKKASTSATAL